MFASSLAVWNNAHTSHRMTEEEDKRRNVRGKSPWGNFKDVFIVSLLLPTLRPYDTAHSLSSDFLISLDRINSIPARRRRMSRVGRGAEQHTWRSSTLSAFCSALLSAPPKKYKNKTWLKCKTAEFPSALQPWEREKGKRFRFIIM